MNILPKTPMNPSVACLIALLRMARLLLDFLEPAVPIVEACREATSCCTLSLELNDPTIIHTMIPCRGIYSRSYFLHTKIH